LDIIVTLNGVFVLVQEHIFQTYRSIAFRPDMFADYLMSREVGFASCERLRPRSRQCIGTVWTRWICHSHCVNMYCT